MIAVSLGWERILTGTHLMISLMQTQLSVYALRELPRAPFSIQAVHSLITALLMAAHYRINLTSWGLVGQRQTAQIFVIAVTYLSNIALAEMYRPLVLVQVPTALLLAAVETLSVTEASRASTKPAMGLAVLMSGMALQLRDCTLETDAARVILQAFIQFGLCATRLYVVNGLELDIYESICRTNLIVSIIGEAFALGVGEHDPSTFGPFDAWQGLVLVAYALMISVGTITSVTAYRTLSPSTAAVLVHVLQTITYVRSNLPAVIVACVGAALYLLTEYKGQHRQSSADEHEVV
jgi:hypothetical protein